MQVVQDLAREVEETQGQGKSGRPREMRGRVAQRQGDVLQRGRAAARELLQGADQIDLTRKRQPEIKSFEARDREKYPWIYMPITWTSSFVISRQARCGWRRGQARR